MCSREFPTLKVTGNIFMVVMFLYFLKILSCSKGPIKLVFLFHLFEMLRRGFVVPVTSHAGALPVCAR